MTLWDKLIFHNISHQPTSPTSETPQGYSFIQFFFKYTRLFHKSTHTVPFTWNIYFFSMWQTSKHYWMNSQFIYQLFCKCSPSLTKRKSLCSLILQHSVLSYLLKTCLHCVLDICLGICLSHLTVRIQLSNN